MLYDRFWPIVRIDVAKLTGWFVPLWRTSEKICATQRLTKITSSVISNVRLTNVRLCKFKFTNQTAPEISHLPSQQPSEIIRNGATFSTEPITAWQGALRRKGNAYETKIQKPPRINLRCATENYPQRISHTGSHMQYRSGGVAVNFSSELRA